MRHPVSRMAMLWLTAFAASATAASAQESDYSTFAYESCAEAASPEPGIIEVRRCAGPAGLPVYWHAEPDSSQIVFGDRARPRDVIEGFFYEVNNVVEWRWVERGTRWPQAAIVRYRYGRSISGLGRSKLAVYRIEANGNSCLMALIDGANANERARRTADRDARSFRCGR